MRSLRTLSIMGLIVGALFSAQASADVWSKASVDLVGVQPDRAGQTGQAYVYLTDTAEANPLFTKRFFRVKGDQSAEALAVLLAASTNDRQVHFLSDVDQVGPNDVATISVLYLTREPVPQ
jgi:hypothetical protein